MSEEDAEITAMPLESNVNKGTKMENLVGMSFFFFSISYCLVTRFSSHSFYTLHLGIGCLSSASKNLAPVTLLGLKVHE